MTLPTYRVEIAFDSGFSTPAASRTWTDVSTYVEGALPLSITGGRADEVSQVPPSRLGLTMNNRDGRFTPGKTGGAYYPNVKKGRPIRVSLVGSGGYGGGGYGFGGYGGDLVRFTGYIDEWHPSWPDSTDAYSTCQLVCSSRTARMGRSAELKSVIEEEVLADSPLAYYALGEPAEAVSAADSSGNQATPLTMAGAGADVVFGNATAAEFAGGKYLTGPTVAADVLECSFSTSTTPGTASVILSVGPGVSIGVGTDGKIHTGSSDLSSPVVTDDLNHTLSWQSGHVLLDGVDIGSPSISPSSGVLSVGGAISGAGPTLPSDPFVGLISDVAVFTSLSTTRATAHSNAILTGFAGELSGARIIRYAGYAGIPADEISADTGQATIGSVDTAGQTPIGLMQKVTETENGVLYDARDGTLVFKARDARYTVPSSFTLSVTAQEVEADLEPKDDDQFLTNDVTASANGTPAGRVIDQTSIDANGYYRQTLDTVTDNIDDALAGAQWAVFTGKDPEPRYTSVTVDVTNSSDAQAAAVLAADIGTRFTLANLPSQAPASSVDMFIEGYSETITATSHAITFNTSPVTGYDVWTIGDAVFGQYDAYPIAY